MTAGGGVISARRGACVASRNPPPPARAMSSPQPLFPVFADLHGRAVLVVGGGTVALRKATALREAGARVRVGAPVLNAELSAMATRGDIEHLPGHFTPLWLDEVWLAIAATDDDAVNRAV